MALFIIKLKAEMIWELSSHLIGDQYDYKLSAETTDQAKSGNMRQEKFCYYNNVLVGSSHLMTPVHRWHL